MCLHVSSDIHEKIPTSYVPKVAERPYQVWKVLRIDGDRWVSPFRLTPFDLNVINTAKFSFDGDGDVEAGLHGFFGSEENARNNWSFNSIERLLPALIPAGAEFFIGDDNEFASNQLIVFHNMKALLNYCGVDELDAPVIAFSL